MGTFINRSQELKVLNDRWQGPRPELMVLYGRRRVGKSALIRAFCLGKPYAYYLATRVTPADARASFRAVLRQATGNTLLDHVQFDTWEAALNTALDVMTQAAAATRGRFCLVLDEFQYLCEASPELPSVLQKWWDTRAKESRCMLILCGSHISFMEAEVLAERSPLFGRRTGQMRLHPLTAWHAGLFLPDWSPLEKLKAFAVLGGVPAYLERFDPQADLRTNVLRELLSSDGYLYDEVNFLLRTELGQAHTYLSLLKAIAGGATRLSEIASRSTIPVTSLSKPLSILVDLGFVTREVPFTEDHPHKSKRGIYGVSDPFTRFWCRYVLPNASLVGEGRGELVWDRFIEPDLPTHLGLVFEELCRSFVQSRVQSLVPGEYALRVGRQWDRDGELDLLATLTDGSTLVGECKAWRGPVGLNVLERLRDRQKTLGGTERKRLALFSTAGFSPEVEAASERDEVILVRLEEILGEQKSLA